MVPAASVMISYVARSLVIAVVLHYRGFVADLIERGSKRISFWDAFFSREDFAGIYSLLHNDSCSLMSVATKVKRSDPYQAAPKLANSSRGRPDLLLHDIGQNIIQRHHISRTFRSTVTLVLNETAIPASGRVHVVHGKKVHNYSDLHLGFLGRSTNLNKPLRNPEVAEADHPDCLFSVSKMTITIHIIGSACQHASWPSASSSYQAVCHLISGKPMTKSSPGEKGPSWLSNAHLAAQRAGRALPAHSIVPRHGRPQFHTSACQQRSQVLIDPGMAEWCVLMKDASVADARCHR